MITPEDAALMRFIEWLAKHNVVLSQWEPKLNELMPIHYSADSLIKKFNKSTSP